MLSLARLFPNKQIFVAQKAKVIDLFTALYRTTEISLQQRGELQELLFTLVKQVKKIHEKIVISSDKQEVETTLCLYASYYKIHKLLVEEKCSEHTLKKLHHFIMSLHTLLLSITTPLHWHRWGQYVSVIGTLIIFGYVLYTTYVGNEYLQGALAKGAGKTSELWAALCDRIIKSLQQS